MFLFIFNNFLKRIPILRTIYSAIGQMTETFTKTDNSEKSVVLLEYPRKGIWVVGFATKENQGIIKNKIQHFISIPIYKLYVCILITALKTFH